MGLVHEENGVIVVTLGLCCCSQDSVYTPV